MPVVFRLNGFRFFFYSNQSDPREPPHIHAMKGEGEAKLWLRPLVSVADSKGIDARTLRWIAMEVVARRDEIERAWHDYFG